MTSLVDVVDRKDMLVMRHWPDVASDIEVAVHLKLARSQWPEDVHAHISAPFSEAARAHMFLVKR